MFRALIPGTDFAPQTACRQPLPTGTARKQTAPQNHDNHQKTIHTHAFTGASRRIRRLRGVQFGRRRPRTAETLRLRHLHGGLHHARIEGRRNGLEKRAAALHLDQRHERRLGLRGLRFGRHGLCRRLRTAGRPDRGEGLGKRHAEIHPGRSRRRLVRLLGLRRKRQPLHGRERGERRSLDGENLERRRCALRLFGQPGRLAGPVGLRLGRRRLRRRQSAKRAHEAARRGLEKRQGALHALRRGDPRRSERALPFGQDALRRTTRAAPQRSGRTRSCSTP